MKKLLASTALALGALVAVTAPALAERTLRLSVQVAVNHPVGANTVTFKDELEKISNGAMKVEIYDAAQLYKGSEIPQAVGSGAIDLGVVLVDEYAGTIPAAGLFSVAFMFPTYEVLAKAADPSSAVRQKIDEMIRQTGTRVLWWQDYGPVQLLSNGTAIVSPEDMKGKKVRALGKPSGDFIEAVGGVPVKISGSEQFLAYQRGTVDIGMTGVTAMKSRKIYEVMDHVTITNHALAEFLVVINDKLWDSLSDQEREWLTAAARVAEMDMRNKTKDDHMAAEKFLREETKTTVVTLTPEQVQAWQKAAEPAVDAYIKAAGPVGQELVDAVRALY
ncbi:MAG: TRAP transporter substrate-binding protein DctP [Alphaproteobacteria bacterium]|nr:TRAP transporter substrate-binding protein DctP [Alphaproteobacteria bacterium]MDX5367785.1 TRAP transporter substrate-binding protein DctP [Alphaproteobacteria bacterium]MDX5462671.1 TRAP transporter substrate-binding protein DctP [Alphaproteobacteria bacterium]